MNPFLAVSISHPLKTPQTERLLVFLGGLKWNDGHK